MKSCEDAQDKDDWRLGINRCFSLILVWFCVLGWGVKLCSIQSSVY